VDGDILPVAPWAALGDGAARDVELLIGHTRDEFSLLATRLGDIGEAEVDTLITGLTPTPGAQRYRAAYPSHSAQELRDTALSDWLYRMPACTSPRQRTRAGRGCGSTSCAGDSDQPALPMAWTPSSCSAPPTSTPGSPKPARKPWLTPGGLRG